MHSLRRSASLWGITRSPLAPGTRNFRQGKLGFHGNLKPLAHPKAFSAWLRTLFRHDWHIYSKRPFAGAAELQGRR